MALRSGDWNSTIKTTVMKNVIKSIKNIHEEVHVLLTLWVGLQFSLEISFLMSVSQRLFQLGFTSKVISKKIETDFFRNTFLITLTRNYPCKYSIAGALNFISIGLFWSKYFWGNKTILLVFIESLNKIRIYLQTFRSFGEKR